MSRMPGTVQTTNDPLDAEFDHLFGPGNGGGVAAPAPQDMGADTRMDTALDTEFDSMFGGPAAGGGFGGLAASLNQQAAAEGKLAGTGDQLAGVPSPTMGPGELAMRSLGIGSAELAKNTARLAQTGAAAVANPMKTLLGAAGRVAQLPYQAAETIGDATGSGPLARVGRLGQDATQQIIDSGQAMPPGVMGPGANLVNQAGGTIANGLQPFIDHAREGLPARARKPYSPEWWVSQIGETIPGVIGAAGGAVAGGMVGGPAGAFAGAFAPSFVLEAGDQASGIYDTRRRQGASEIDALTDAFLPAVATGLFNAGVESLAGPEAAIAKKVAHKSAENALLSIGKQMVEEGLTEPIQGAATDLVAGGTTGEMASAGEFFSQRAQEAALGAAMGGIMGGAVEVGGKVGERLDERARAERAERVKAVMEERANARADIQNMRQDVAGEAGHRVYTEEMGNAGASSAPPDTLPAQVVEAASAANAARQGVPQPAQAGDEGVQDADGGVAAQEAILQKLMRGEQLTEQEQRIVGQQQQRLQSLASASAQDAAKMSPSDFEKWKGSRSNPTTDQAMDLAAAALLRGDNLLLRSVKNIIADRFVEPSEETRNNPDDLRAFEARQQEWRDTLDAIEEAEKQYAAKQNTANPVERLTRGELRGIVVPWGSKAVTPPGMRMMEVGTDGRVIFDPKRITAREVLEARAQGRLGEVLAAGAQPTPTDADSGTPAPEAEAQPQARGTGTEARTPGQDQPSLDSQISALEAETQQGMRDQARRRDDRMDEMAARQAMDAQRRTAGEQASVAPAPAPTQSQPEQTTARQSQSPLPTPAAHQRESVSEQPSFTPGSQATYTRPNGTKIPVRIVEAEGDRVRVQGPNATFLAKPGQLSVGAARGEAAPNLMPSQKLKAPDGVNVTNGNETPVGQLGEGGDVGVRNGVGDDEAAHPAPPSPKSTRDIEDSVSERWPDARVEITPRQSDQQDRTVWYLDAIELPKSQRGKGVGSEIMRHITDSADRAGAIIAAEPTLELGGESIERLSRFYEAFGFERNNGDDPSLTSAMIRRPKPDSSTGKPGLTVEEPRTAAAAEKEGAPKRPTVDLNHARVRVGRLVQQIARRGPMDSVGRVDGWYSELQAHLRDLDQNGALTDDIIKTARRVYDDAGLSRALRRDGGSPAAASPPGFERRKNEVKSSAQASGWSFASKPDDQFLRLERPDGRTLIARSVREGVWVIETSWAKRETPRGKNALNTEPTQAVSFDDRRPLEWDGKREFEGPQVFRVLRDYMEANPATAPAERADTSTKESTDAPEKEGRPEGLLNNATPATAPAAKAEGAGSLIERITDMLVARGIPKQAVGRTASAVAQVIETGSYSDIMHPDNKNSRAVFQELTGEKLPKGVEATKRFFKGQPFTTKQDAPQATAPGPLTAQRFRDQLRAVAKSQDEADAAYALVEARAASAGETVDEYVGRRIAGVRRSTSAPEGALEQARENLVVVHNLSADNIRFADELGGLAMPSVAVSSVDDPITGFGEISLVAPKSLIDPKASRTNRVYDADVYSPRYPSARYKMKSEPSIWKKIEQWVKDTYGDLRSESIKAEDYEIRSVLYGLASHLDSISFEDRGIEKLYDDDGLRAYYAGTVLGQTFKGTDRGDGREGLADAIKGHKDDYEKWVRDNFAKHIDRKLFKGYTNAGNRRYGEYTLENVMKEMRKAQREDGGESFFYGAGSVRAKVAKKYKSIPQIQKDRGRIVSRESFEEAKKDMDRRLIDVAEKGRGAFEGVSDTDFGFPERFWSLVFEIKRRGPSVAKEWRADPDALPWAEINEFLNDLRNLPTEYFEAKLDREVRLSEFSGAVVPKETPQEVVDLLAKHGITEIERYTKGDDKDRARALNALATRQSILFQASSTNTDTPAFKRWFGDSKVVDRDGKPLVVYHGTWTENLTAFDRLAKAKERRGAKVDTIGSWFTTDQKSGRAYGPQVVEAYLSIKNPRRYKGTGDRDTRQQAAKQLWADVERYGDAEQFRAAMRERGYDGIVIENDNLDGLPGDVWVAFEPEQIKSVNNRGTFDPANPNILYQSRDATNLERLDDALRPDAEAIRNLAHSEPFRTKGLSSLNVPLQDASLARVFRLGQDRQIREAVIRSLPVDVVDVLARAELSPEVLLHDPSVFADLVSIDRDNPIALGVDEASSAPGGVTRGRAVGGVTSTGASREGRTARSASAPDATTPEKVVAAGAAKLDLPAASRMKLRDGLVASATRVLGHDGSVLQLGAFDNANVMEQAKKGAIEFLKDGRAIIHAFESADVSTLAHELGHLFRRDLTGEDLEAARRWAGAGKKSWSREAEEKFARAFERYLRTGRAPTAKLAEVFEKFKQWLTNIYEKLVGSEIDVEITPEIRGVFDRLLGAQKPGKGGISMIESPGAFVDRVPIGSWVDWDSADGVKMGRIVRKEMSPPRVMVESDDGKTYAVQPNMTGSNIREIGPFDVPAKPEKKEHPAPLHRLAERIRTIAGMTNSNMAGEVLREWATAILNDPKQIARFEEFVARDTESRYRPELLENALATFRKDVGEAEPAKGGQSAASGNMYAGGKGIIGAGIDAGTRMTRAEKINKSSKDPAVKAEAQAIWAGINDGTMTNEEADARLDAIEATPATPKAPGQQGGFLSNMSQKDQDRAAELAKRLRAKLNNEVRSGFDPEMFAIGAELASIYIEAGAKRFRDFSARMVQEIGDTVVPYLKSFYNGARDMPGVDAKGMDPAAEVSALTDAQIRGMVGDEGDATIEDEGETDGRTEDQADKPGRDAPGTDKVVPDGGRAPGGERPGADGDVEREGDGAGEPSAPEGERDGESGGAPAKGRSRGGSRRGGRGRVPGTAKGRSERGRKGDAVSSESDLDEIAAELAERRANLPGPARNHRIQDEDVLIVGSGKAKAQANLRAIKLWKSLTEADRLPTADEKKILAQYTGWGDTELKPYLDRLKLQEIESNEKYGYHDATLDAWEKKHGKLARELRDTLTDEEYRAAAASTANAHYTSRDVISNGLWAIARRLGFKGGHVLENSAGIGHVIGLMPEDLYKRSFWTAVELDETTSGMLKLLYPEELVHRSGFEDAKIPNNTVDLVIGNPPFHKQGPTDETLPNFSLHNYMLAKSIMVAKPGAILVQITSSSTLDNHASKKFREWASSRVDLVGAIRLPNNAFLENAGTQVTTDILVFRKKDGTPFRGEPWLNVRAMDTKPPKKWDEEDGPPPKTVDVNEYYHIHPEMMLGEMGLEGTMYGPYQPALTVRPGQDTIALLRKAVESLPADVMAQTKVKRRRVTGGEATGLEFSYQERDGKIFQQIDGELVEPEWMQGSKGKANKDRARGLIAMREATKSLIDAQLDENVTDQALEAQRKALKSAYEKFVKKHGRINDASNSRIFSDDPQWALLASLESVEETLDGDDDGAQTLSVKISPRQILEKRTQWPPKPPTSAETPADAVAISESWRGSLDMDYVAELRGLTREEAVDELLDNGLAFRVPDSGVVVSREEYLSGNVRAKLKQAELAAKDDPEFTKNVEALKPVIPADLPISQVAVQWGAGWVPAEAMQSWVDHLFWITAANDVHAAEFSFDEATGRYTAKWHHQIDSLPANKVTHASGSQSAHMMLTDALSMTPTVVKVREVDDNGTERYVVDQKQTEAAQEKQRDLVAAFERWARTSKYAEQLSRIYNDTFNATVMRTYPTPKFTRFPGQSEAYYGHRAHQLRAVLRAVRESIILGHEVGAGKTMVFCSAAMEWRRLGLATKPMIAVMKSTVGQIVETFKEMYPQANILTPQPKDFEPANRKKLFARIATGDYDAVIVTHEQLGKIQDDQKRMEGWLNEQIKMLEAKIIVSRAGKRKSGKKDQSQKAVEDAIKRLKEMLEKVSKRDTDEGLTFEQLGIDGLIVDESHKFKKIYFDTDLENVKGLDTAFSKRGLGLLMKARWVQQQNNNRNIILSTGTPVTNTIAESWNVMRLVRPDLMSEVGMSTFDQFAGQFSAVLPDAEIDAAGRFREVRRMTFNGNVRELSKIFAQVADMAFLDDMPEIKRPKIEGGKPKTIAIEPGTHLQAIMKELVELYEWYEGLKGQEKRRNRHIPIVIEGRSKQAAIDVRLYDPRMPKDNNAKIDRVADEIVKRWKETEKDLGTQLVFTDRYQTPDTEITGYDEETGDPIKSKVPPERRFNFFDALRDELVARGIPREQIAHTGDFDGDSKKAKARKAAVFQGMNDGTIRVLMGTTERCGTGVNVQKRLKALHHLDAPYRPADREQRDGRGQRQGNIWDNIEILEYGMVLGFDAGGYQRLARKRRAFQRFLKGTLSAENMGDLDDEGTAGYEEAAASFSGDPLIKERFVLKKEVQRLRMLEAAHADEVFAANQKIKELIRSIAEHERRKDAYAKFAEENATEFEKPTEILMSVGYGDAMSRDQEKAFLESKLKEFSEKIAAMVADKSTYMTRKKEYGHEEYVGRVSFGGIQGTLSMFQRWDSYGNPGDKPYFIFAFDVGRNEEKATGESGQGLRQSLYAKIKGIAAEPAAVQRNIDEAKSNLAAFEEQKDKPFAQAEALEKAKTKYDIVREKLAAQNQDGAPTKEDKEEFREMFKQMFGTIHPHGVFTNEDHVVQMDNFLGFVGLNRRAKAATWLAETLGTNISEKNLEFLVEQGAKVTASNPAIRAAKERAKIKAEAEARRKARQDNPPDDAGGATPGGPTSAPREDGEARARTLSDWADRVIADTRARRARTQLPRGRNIGGGVIGAELRDAAVIAFARAVKAGDLAGRALTRHVEKAITDLHLSVESRRVRKLVKAMIAASTDEAGKVSEQRADEAIEALFHADDPKEKKAPAPYEVRLAKIAQAVLDKRITFKQGIARIKRIQAQRTPGVKTGVEEVERRTGIDRAGPMVTMPAGKLLTMTMNERRKAAREAFKAGVEEGTVRTVRKAIPQVERMEKEIASRVPVRTVLRAYQQVKRLTAQETIRDFRQNVIPALKRQAEFKELQSKAIRKTLLAEVKKLPASLQGKFLRRVRDIRGYHQLREALDAVDREAMLFEARVQARRGRSLSNERSLRRLPEDDGMGGKPRADAKAWLAQAEQAFKDLRAAEEAHRKYPKRTKGEDVNVYRQRRYAHSQQHLATMKGLLDTIRDNVEAVDQAVHYEKTKHDAYVLGQKVQAAGFRKEMIDALVANAKPIKAGRDDSETEARNSPFMRRVARYLSSLSTLTKRFDGDWDGAGRWHQVLVKTFREADRAKLFRLRELIEKAEKAAEAAGYSSMGDAFARLTGTYGVKYQEKVKIVVGQKTIEVPKGVAMDIWAHASDLDTSDLLARGQTINFRRNRLVSPKPVDVPSVYRALSQQERDFVFQMKAIKDLLFPEMDATHRRLKGVSLERQPGHWSRTRNTAMSEKLGQADGWKQIADFHLDNSGFLKRRTGGRVPILVGDFLENWHRQVSSMLQFTYLAEPVRSAEMLALHPDVKDPMVRFYGESMIRRIERGIQDAGGTSPFREFQWHQRLVRSLMARTGRALTSLNRRSWAKQLGGVFKIQAAMPLETWKQGMRRMGQRGLLQRIMDNSADFWHRWASAPHSRFTGVMDGFDALEGGKFVEGLTATLGNLKSGRLMGADKALQQTLNTIKISNYFDSIPARVAWAGYEWQVEQEHPTWTKEEKMKWVADKAWQAFSDTQNTTGATDSGAAYSNARHDPALGMVIQFSSDSSKSFDMLYAAMHQGKKQRAKVAAAILANALWSSLVVGTGGSLLYAAIAAVFGGSPDWDKAKKDALTAGGWQMGQEIANLIPGFGPLTEKIRAASQPWRSGSVFDNPTTGTIDQFADAAMEFSRALFEDEKMGLDSKSRLEKLWRATYKAIRAAATAEGIPAGPIMSDVKGVVDAYSGD